MTAFLTLHPDQTDTLQCPVCGGAFTHVDAVEITTSAGQIFRIAADGEDSSTWLEMRANVDPEVGAEQRRHTITLIGTCENCPGFRLEFKQHKGVTILTGTALARG